MKRGSRRGGYSLIEMVTFLSLAGVLFGLAGVLLHQVFLLSRADAGRVAASTLIERLGAELRADAHSARGVNRADAARLAFDMGTAGRVEYAIESGKIVRSRIATDGKTRRDVHVLMRPVKAETFVSESGGKRFAGFAFDPGSPLPGSGASIFRRVVVEAEVGRESRLLEEPKS
jgi:Tfp pilus assembly protein FimT